MARKPQGERALTVVERMRVCRQRQRERERAAVADPAAADDATLARLMTRAVAGLEREQRRSPATAKLQKYLIVKYGREFCNRYEAEAAAFLAQIPTPRRRPS